MARREGEPPYSDGAAGGPDPGQMGLIRGVGHGHDGTGFGLVVREPGPKTVPAHRLADLEAAVRVSSFQAFSIDRRFPDSSRVSRA